MEEAPRPYWDVVLSRNRRKLLSLYRHLLKIGLVTIACPGSAVETLGIFFVKKTGKEQDRLILDCRRINRLFVNPPGVELCSSEALARLEIQLPDNVLPGSPEAGEALRQVRVALGLADVKDCFHRYKVPLRLARFFGVGRAIARELGIVGTPLEGEPLGPESEVDLLWNSLPMGFSWSLYFAQVTAESLMSQAPSLSDAPRITDRSGPAVFTAGSTGVPSHGKAWYAYVDNLGVLGLVLAEVTQGLSEAVALFDQAGLETHEFQVLEGAGKALGTILDGEALETRLAPQRFWRVYQGLGYALQCRRLPGRVWEILLGHATFCALVRRELLSCFNCIYAFIRKNTTSPNPCGAQLVRKLLHSVVVCSCYLRTGLYLGLPVSVPVMPV